MREKLGELSPERIEVGRWIMEALICILAYDVTPTT
jgi:hypothetical protein